MGSKWRQGWMEAVDTEALKQKRGIPHQAFSNLTTRKQVVELNVLRRAKKMKWVKTPKSDCTCVYNGAESKPCEMHRKQALGKYWTLADYKIHHSPAYNLVRK